MRQAGALNLETKLVSPREITDMGERLIAAMRDNDPSAFIGETETDVFVIDGEFRLRDIARQLCGKLPKHHA